MSKKVIIMRGIPGSGKSRWVRSFVKHNPDTVVCSSDYFFEVNGKFIEGYGITKEYRFDPTKLPEAHNQCMFTFLTALKEEKPIVVVDNTNIYHWEYMNYKLAAELAGYTVEIVEILVETLRQVNICIARNNHMVPSEIIARLAIEYEPCPFLSGRISIPVSED